MFGPWQGAPFGLLGMLVGLLLPILVLGLGIAGVFWLLSRSSATSRTVGPEPDLRTNSPLDIARERYARGEISREEYMRIRQDLESRQT